MGIIQKLRRFLITIRHLKPVQIRYQIYYRFISPFFSFLEAHSELSGVLEDTMIWKDELFYPKTLTGYREFKFLNQTFRFEKEINWEKSEFGKLWTYNLNYFDFLNQENPDASAGLQLIKNYIAYKKHETGNEPYPTSLRGINWIKFLSRHKINNHSINTFLFKDYVRLTKKLEYHILGNHLLENAFSLLFGGIYFNNSDFLSLAHKVLTKQLQEQILDDGAHFERSPMYHRILLHRTLDCINLLQLNEHKEGIYKELKNTASKMISWLEAISFSDGSVPMVNDSIHEFSFKTRDLISFAKTLGLKWEAKKLDSSGYRMFKKQPFELFTDFGNIGPDYIPGHAHSDTFNFEIYIEGKPFIVDTGTSTYEPGVRRHIERSTISHNTVLVNSEEQSDVWGNFRVGRRAKVTVLEDTPDSVKGVHDGYKHRNIFHSRSIHQLANGYTIEDNISQKKADDFKAEAFIHLHPSVKDVECDKNNIRIASLGINISFDGMITMPSLEGYKYATGYNTTTEAVMIRIEFKNQLITKITKF